MQDSSYTIREILLEDIDQITQYWLCANDDALSKMGVDKSKILSAPEWKKFLQEQIASPLNQKNSYCLIWLLNGKAVGHSNVNKIIFGESAYMHLHMWTSTARKKGAGLAFIKLCIPKFFEILKLKTIFCEPKSDNEAPNKTLAKVGFTFVKKHSCIPGWICFEQEVNLWELKAPQ